MPTAERIDPQPAINFRVEIDGLTPSGFLEVSGLEAEIAVIDYREGTDKSLSPRKLTGLVKYSNITLKRGVTNDPSLWNWMKEGLDGKVNRRNGSIVLLAEDGQEVRRWNFVNGWPAKYSGPHLDASANDAAIETIEIAHEGLTLA